MNKKELIEALADYPDDADIMVVQTVQGVTSVDAIVSASPNGYAVQLEGESFKQELARMEAEGCGDAECDCEDFCRIDSDCYLCNPEVDGNEHPFYDGGDWGVCALCLAKLRRMAADNDREVSFAFGPNVVKVRVEGSIPKFDVEAKDHSDNIMLLDRGSNERTIMLMTGYTIDLNDKDWVPHLTNALIGEVFTAVSESGSKLGWDDRMRLVVGELARVCDAYGLSPMAWFPHVMIELQRMIETALPGMQGGN